MSPTGLSTPEAVITPASPRQRTTVLLCANALEHAAIAASRYIFFIFFIRFCFLSCVLKAALQRRLQQQLKRLEARESWRFRTVSVNFSFSKLNESRSCRQASKTCSLSGSHRSHSGQLGGLRRGESLRTVPARYLEPVFVARRRALAAHAESVRCPPLSGGSQ